MNDRNNIVQISIYQYIISISSVPVAVHVAFCDRNKPDTARSPGSKSSRQGPIESRYRRPAPPPRKGFRLGFRPSLKPPQSRAPAAPCPFVMDPKCRVDGPAVDGAPRQASRPNPVRTRQVRDLSRGRSLPHGDLLKPETRN